MPRNIYSEINLHITWHVKNSAPIIGPEIEPGLHKYIRSYALQTMGVIFHEMAALKPIYTLPSAYRRLWRLPIGSES